LDFLLSISKRADFVASQLGKSKSVFFYSHDKRYLLKLVSAKEMLMFEDMAPNYFRHMAKHVYHQMPSQLIKTIGAFSVSIQGATGEDKKSHYLLAVNLEAIMPPNSKIFDLKGTLNARRYVKDGDTRTKMDLNFTEEYHSLPLCLRLVDKQKLDAGLWNDSLFLAKQNVIDYSLLVIVNEEREMIATGIIDYMQHYTVDKVVESKYKTVVGREQPTITDPVVYKTRFREQLMFEYFVGVTS
jgi:1-phosphatidylinositol-3-phosphate 5-kinase